MIAPYERPIGERGKLSGDVPSAAAILGCFLRHAVVTNMKRKSHRLGLQATRETTVNTGKGN